MLSQLKRTERTWLKATNKTTGEDTKMQHKASTTTKMAADDRKADSMTKRNTSHNKIEDITLNKSKSKSKIKKKKSMENLFVSLLSYFCCFLLQGSCKEIESNANSSDGRTDE